MQKNFRKKVKRRSSTFLTTTKLYECALEKKILFLLKTLKENESMFKSDSCLVTYVNCIRTTKRNQVVNALNFPNFVNFGRVGLLALERRFRIRHVSVNTIKTSSYY